MNITNIISFMRQTLKALKHDVKMSVDLVESHKEDTLIDTTIDKAVAKAKEEPIDASTLELLRTIDAIPQLVIDVSKHPLGSDFSGDYPWNGVEQCRIIVLLIFKKGDTLQMIICCRDLNGSLARIRELKRSLMADDYELYDIAVLSVCGYRVMADTATCISSSIDHVLNAMEIESYTAKGAAKSRRFTITNIEEPESFVDSLTQQLVTSVKYQCTRRFIMLTHKPTNPEDKELIKLIMDENWRLLAYAAMVMQLYLVSYNQFIDNRKVIVSAATMPKNQSLTGPNNEQWTLSVIQAMKTKLKMEIHRYNNTTLIKRLRAQL